MQITLHQIQRALAGHQPRFVEAEPHHAAASVALVLAGGAELSLCLIRRAERAGDPWSGHLALPGGHSEPTDAHPRAAAERETLEEVGLALGDGQWLGALSQLPVRLGGGAVQLVLSSFARSSRRSPGATRSPRRFGCRSPTCGTPRTPAASSGAATAGASSTRRSAAVAPSSGASPCAS
jgi:8-oxo-dGTP pyrophosphatase MutT (NUDIX family)